MATKKAAPAKTSKTAKVVGPKPGEFPGKIVDVDVSHEMSESFLEYAYSRNDSDISEETSISTILPANSPGFGP